jgi:hypothetical protein
MTEHFVWFSSLSEAAKRQRDADEGRQNFLKRDGFIVWFTSQGRGISALKDI